MVYVLFAVFFGYDTTFVEVDIEGDEVHNINFYPAQELKKVLKNVKVNAARQQKQVNVRISQNTIRPKTLTRIPSVGGEPDLVQYLQVLPGVVFSGDQGGQLYIRGGSPVMNRVMLDGLTVYNPFHSIGLVLNF